jgi:transcriptional regulator with XRE-family HTH domain
VNWIDGEKVTALRKQQGLDQLGLAEAANVAQSVISRMERGMQSDYKLSVIVSIARVLGVTVDSLLIQSEAIDRLDPEFQAIITILENRDKQTQRIVAKTIRGLLEGLDENGS